MLQSGLCVQLQSGSALGEFRISVSFLGEWLCLVTKELVVEQWRGEHDTPVPTLRQLIAVSACGGLATKAATLATLYLASSRELFPSEWRGHV
jgi:hypothetical protein